MNKCTLYGNVGKDPDVKKLESGNTVAKFSLATNKSYTKNGEKITETAWHNIVLWNKLAELAGKYVKKGHSLIIEGEISYRSYENKDGITIYTTDIIGREMYFVGSKESKSETNEGEWKKGDKRDVKSMSDASELPGYVDDGNIPDESPF